MKSWTADPKGLKTENRAVCCSLRNAQAATNCIFYIDCVWKIQYYIISNNSNNAVIY